jgi:hypothetical protein
MPWAMPMSAASARRVERLLVKATSVAVIAVALVTPALGSGHSSAAGPATLTELEVVHATPTAITLSWHEREARRIGAYRIFKNEKFVTETTATSYTLDDLRCGTAYVLGVEAVDADGHRSARETVTAASAPCPAQPAKEPMPTPAPTAQESAPAQAVAPLPQPVPPTLQPATPESQTDLPPPQDTTSDLWKTAGAFVWHETAVDPEALGRQLRENGFGWVAVLLHDGLTVDPIEDDWVRRFREASGLPVGGWGVLRTQPELEAQLAQTLLERNGLDFYIADAEAEYKYSSELGPSDVRYQRSRRFVDTFRAALPDLPAALSSYCRADRQDIDWKAWSSAGFEFMPQAYVNDFGDYATPAVCTEAATGFFPADAVHPTIGMYPGQDDQVAPDRYAQLLGDAHTVGFSVYLAETRTEAGQWNVLGSAIGTLGIARLPRVGGNESVTSPDDSAPAQSGLR